MSNKKLSPKKLGNIAHIEMGQSPDSVYYLTEAFGVPLIQGNADIKNRQSIQRIWTTYVTKECSAGDILMTVRAPVGSIGIASRYSCIGRGVCAIKATDVYSDYLYHLLIYNEENWKALEQGSTFTAVNFKEIFNFPLLVVNSKTEQKKIAQILSTTDTVIEKTQATIAKYKAIKQGMLNDLFIRGIDIKTGKLRLNQKDAPELYKESELGWIPKEWDMDKLEHLTEKIGSGVTPTGGSEIYKTSGVLFLRSQNVLVSRLNIKDAAFITTEIDEKMAGSRVKPFDVLLNITGASIGRCAYFPVELNSANVNQHVCIIRFKNSSSSLAFYASEFMNSHFGQSQINRSNAGGNREGLNFQQIKSFSFPVVIPSELDKIATIIESQANFIQIEINYLQKLQKIKSGLMADLLSGNKLVSIPKEMETQNVKQLVWQK